MKDDPQKWQPTARVWRWQKCTEMAYLSPPPPTGDPQTGVGLEVELEELG